MDDSVGLIERHLSEDQMKEIAADEWRSMCRDYFGRIGHSVAIGNVVYPMVRRAVDETLGGDAVKLIAEKAIEVISDLSAYTVFHAPNVYDKEPSEAWKVLQSIVKDNRAALEARIQHHIHNLSKADALEIIRASRLTIETRGEA